MTWRERARKIIQRTRARCEAAGMTGAGLRANVGRAYPWGERTRHPYLAWCKAMEDEFGPSERALRARAARMRTFHRPEPLASDGQLELGI